jgi:nucleoside-diphosphate-sugar epimerase
VKIILPGGAGLVGQNLIIRLKIAGYKDITVIDKHKSNVLILRNLHPDINIIESDLSLNGNWVDSFNGADAVVMLQAQIGSNKKELFYKNNIKATNNIINAMEVFSVSYLVHISSSVVKSVSNDDYTNSKKRQENIVINSGIENIVLRPTLMFGWFDRKHLGWLSRFMKKIPIFPIPGNGNYIRQPLYVGDFCNIIISCIENKIKGKIYNISGLEYIYYIDIIRQIKDATHSKTLILKIPYTIFYNLLWFWGLFDKNPPFTTKQLVALVEKEEFEVIEWPVIFDVLPTPFDKAINETFCDSKYSNINLNF